MAIQDFCKDCPHRLISSSLKEKFNKEVQNVFLHCPQTDRKVVGCLIKKNFNINWGAFGKMLEDEGDLAPKEKNNLKMLGIYETEDIEETSDNS